jgi:hypothetical protein
MATRRTLSEFKQDFGFSAKSLSPTRVFTQRREPDEATTRMFTAIHRNRSDFSVTTLAAAFSKIRTRKIG